MAHSHVLSQSLVGRLPREGYPESFTKVNKYVLRRKSKSYKVTGERLVYIDKLGSQMEKRCSPERTKLQSQVNVYTDRAYNTCNGMASMMQLHDQLAIVQVKAIQENYKHARSRYICV